MKEFKTIVLATDFSECSDEAFDYAQSICRMSGAKMVLVHIICEPVDLRGFYVPHISFDVLEKEIEDGAKRMMDEFCRERMTSEDTYETRVVPGIAYNEIITQAQELGADLIVMGTHGRSGLDHVLFGSTAEKVVRKSPVPVLTVTRQ